MQKEIDQKAKQAEIDSAKTAKGSADAGKKPAGKK